MVTKIGTGDYVPDIHPYAKLHNDPIGGFCPRICEVAYQNVHSAIVFFEFFQLLPPRPLHTF